MIVIEMRTLVFLECVFPRVRFCTMREGTMMSFPLMMDAFSMAIKIGFPTCFIATFASKMPAAAELCGRRVESTCRRI